MSRWMPNVALPSLLLFVLLFLVFENYGILEVRRAQTMQGKTTSIETDSNKREERKSDTTSSSNGQGGVVASNTRAPAVTTQTPVEVVYHGARTDRSGTAIDDMLRAHAYAYSKGYQYGGACPSTRKNVSPERQETDRKHQNKTNELLHSLGLDSILPFACPVNATLISRKDYAKVPLREEWFAHVRSNLDFLPHDKDLFRVAVHVRRDDVSPCAGGVASRYLPNQYFLDVIDKHLPIELEKYQNETGRDPRVEVTVFSMPGAFEPLDVFYNRNYTVYLEDDLAYIWRFIMSANMVFASLGKFSVVPALLNPSRAIIGATRRDVELYKAKVDRTKCPNEK